MTKTIDGIFFDADGTLFDSNKLHYLAYEATVKELYDYDLSWEVFYHNVLVTSKKGIELLGELGLQVDKKIFYELKDSKYVKLVKTELQPMPGIKDFLMWCKENNIRCFVVTNGKLDPLKVALSTLKLDTFFENIVAAEHSGDLLKPHSYPYKLALNLAQIPPHQAMAIEDTAGGISSANKAGLWCAGIKHDTNRAKDLSRAEITFEKYDDLRRILSANSPK